MDIQLDQQAKGVRLLTGEEAKRRRTMITSMIVMAMEMQYEEVLLPLVEPAEIYTDKAGPEILGQMYTFQDKGERNLCLRPEGTATIQLLARGPYQHHKDVKFFYETRCWRYEKPQAGRYREFTQFGVEWLWPRDPKEAREQLIHLACRMVSLFNKKFEVFPQVKRGLSYYTEDGFEISIPSLGAQKQVCGGGAYAEGIGFAIGIDRLILGAEDAWPTK